MSQTVTFKCDDPNDCASPLNINSKKKKINNNLVN